MGWDFAGEEMDRWVRETRMAQGLPPTIEDPVVLDQVARILTGCRTYKKGSH